MRVSFKLICDETLSSNDGVFYSPLGSNGLRAVNASIHGSEEAWQDLEKNLPNPSAGKWRLLGKRSNTSHVDACIGRLNTLFDEVAKGRLKIIFTFARADNDKESVESQIIRGQYEIVQRAIQGIKLLDTDYTLDFISDIEKEMPRKKRKLLSKQAQDSSGDVMFHYGSTIKQHPQIQLADYLAGFFAHTFNGFEEVQGNFPLSNGQTIGAQRINARSVASRKIETALHEKLGIIIERNKPGLFTRTSDRVDSVNQPPWPDIQPIQAIEILPPN